MATSDIPKNVMVMLTSNSTLPCYCLDKKQSEKLKLSLDDFKDILLWASEAEPYPPELFFLADAEEPMDPTIASVAGNMPEQIITPLVSLERQKALGIPYSKDQTVIVEDLGSFVSLSEDILGRPVILHVAQNEISKLAETVLLVQESIGPIRFCLRDAHLLTDEDIKVYRQQLEKLADVSLMKEASGYEGKLNVLALKGSEFGGKANRRCDAGQSFVTIGPDGNFYPCPAFYYLGSKYSLGSIKTVATEPPVLGADRKLCGMCNLNECPGCLFYESTTLAGKENICKIYSAESQAARELMHRTAESGYMFECLRTLKFREAAHKSEDEGKDVTAGQQAYNITLDEFSKALKDIKSAAENGEKTYSSQWEALPQIPEESQRAVFRRRVKETLEDLRQLKQITASKQYQATA